MDNLELIRLQEKINQTIANILEAQTREEAIKHHEELERLADDLQELIK